MGDIWKNKEKDNRNIWTEVSRMHLDTEKQNTEESMTENRLLVTHNELKNNYKKETYIEACIQKASRGKGWWKMST
jgi:hypothetical protein